MTDQLSSLTKANVDSNPFRQFEQWSQDVRAAGVSEQDTISMTLATATRFGAPSARIVLLKSFDERGFVFYTNYNSRKGNELEANAQACLLFYWPQLWRQVRIEGTVERVSAAESDEYFHSRPLGSRIGAWASEQSSAIDSRAALDQRFQEFTSKFGDHVPRPPHWGGYRVKPNVIEFWQGQENRLHDRLRFTSQDNGEWSIERLAP
ncbi:MAG TPA: pyridoxamine 5'-phosphate oxidase [Pyrinomonadaceae bacterium]|jgi:pyridoxamine 5'-phosphate oxidase|nr:pyridoxamine 5'-phosphate oxidase [Pyrinomonadaceae bacterium]